MLLSFRVSNYRSIKEEQELLFVRSRKMANYADRPNSDSRYLVSPVAAIYGPNASGKSNFLRALQFFKRAITDSHSKWGPDSGVGRAPFGFDPACEALPTRLEAEVLLDGVRYQYGFEYDNRRFLKEWLYVYPGSRRQVWFERDADADEEWFFGKLLGGRNRITEEVTRDNSLFISAAATLDHPKLSPLYRWFSGSLRFANTENHGSRLRYTISQIDKNPTLASGITALLKHADLGITGLKIKHKKFSLEEIRRIERIAQALAAEGGPEFPEAGPELENILQEAAAAVELTHAYGDGEPVSLPFNAESLGTTSLLALGGPVLDALAKSECLVVDEIDTSLHPALVAELVLLFQDTEINRNGAQLIFTTHDVSLLAGHNSESPVLDRDQVWFIEKDAYGASHVYPLTDFGPRKLENLARGYLQGRYGAIPHIAGSLVGDSATCEVES